MHSVGVPRRKSPTNHRSSRPGKKDGGRKGERGGPEPRRGKPEGSDSSGSAVPLAHRVVMAFAVSVPFAGCLAAIIMLWMIGWMGWLYVGMLIGGWILTGLGVTVGFHRLLTHRSFETYHWMRGFWTAMGALSVEGSPLSWCAVHRRHHAYSDKQGDPHSPHLHGQGWRGLLKGLCHAHIGWLFTSYWSKSDLMHYVPDLLKDKLLVFVDRLYYLWVLASLAIPAVLGGLLTLSWMGVLLGFIWGGLVRIFMTHHITWSINSICHVFGRKQYQTPDHSTNNWVCGLLGLGEGWHNNHHAFPVSARHGLHWWQFDLSWIVISGMRTCRLAWNVQTPHPRQVASKRIR